MQVKIIIRETRHIPGGTNYFLGCHDIPTSGTSWNLTSKPKIVHGPAPYQAEYEGLLRYAERVCAKFGGHVFVVDEHDRCIKALEWIDASELEADAPAGQLACIEQDPKEYPVPFPLEL